MAVNHLVGGSIPSWSDKPIEVLERPARCVPSWSSREFGTSYLQSGDSIEYTSER